MYQIRRFFMRLGRKYCLSEEIRQEFKRIKMCKKQAKYASMQLEYLKLQLGYQMYEKIEAQRREEQNEGLGLGNSSGKKKKKHQQYI